uniref:Uncharacterized protein n=1 Tax=Variovorax paradoxus (strain S110) TaxID=543728 RepID=C5D073_VARPS
MGLWSDDRVEAKADGLPFEVGMLSAKPDRA